MDVDTLTAVPPRDLPPAPPQPAVHIVQPRHGWPALELGELWQWRELVYFLAWRDVKVRYKQTALGAAWALLQPLTTMLVFSVVFGRLGRLPSDGVPYPCFALAALVPWTYFTHALGDAAHSLVANQHLLRKVYFPRLAMPLAPVLAGLVDVALSLAVLVALVAAWGLPLDARALLAPVALLLPAATAFGAGLWLAALNVRYRDVRYVLPFLLQLWLFASPVAYASSLVPPGWRPVYALNPMAGAVDAMRWAVLGTPAEASTVAISAAVAGALCASGLLVFRRLERQFADVV